MKKQAGFTLIELVIVIIILGILAVTAAPKFLNLQGDARKSVAEGAEGAIKAAAEMVYSKAIIDGKDNSPTDTVTADGNPINTVFGYPAATPAGIEQAVELEGVWSTTMPTIAHDGGNVPAPTCGTGACTFFYWSNEASDKCVIGYKAAADDTDKATTAITAECGQ